MIRQRELLVRSRRRLALLATLGILATAIFLEHSGLGHGEMADGEIGQAISVCLAIVEAGAVFAGAAALLKIRPRFAAAPSGLPAAPALSFAGTGSKVPAAPARAGPSVLQVFRS